MPARPARSPHPVASAPARTRERAAVLDPLRARMHAAVDALADQAPLELLRTASAAQTGAGSLAAMLSALPEANPALAGADPEAAAIARGALLKQEMMATIPMWPATQVAAHLGVTPAAVRKARAEGRLLAVDYGGQAHYPAFQFTRDGVRSGVREVLAALSAVPIESDWVRLDFFTAPDAAEEDARSVADLLRDGEIAQALDVVRGYGEQGA